MISNLHTIKKIILGIFIFLLGLPLSSQNGQPKTLTGKDFQCGTDYMHRKMMETDSIYREKVIANEQLIQEIIKKKKRNHDKAPGVFNICVVAHVIHLGEPVGTGTNISDAQIQSAITALNDDFRKIGQGFNSHPDGADVELQFNLAVQDPNGLPTTGINRVNGSSVPNYTTNGITSTNDAAVKALSIWPNTKYYNIWIVSEINGNNAGGGTQGYAYFPGASPSLDGTVLLFNACGTIGNLKSFTNLNRTLTHEIGHGFNLYHTFEGGSCTQTSCSTQGDYCCDTPPTKPGNTCVTSVCAGAQIENYMDYSGEACKNVFTNDQKARMRATLFGPRASLLSSVGCTAITPPISDFNSTPNIEICEGEQIQFTDISTMTPTAWSWSFPGGTPTNSTNKNPLITYNAAGIYPVTLTASNFMGAGTIETKNGYIIVNDSPVNNGTVVLDASCLGSFNGSINLSLSGSNSPFSYLWSTGATTQNISNIGADTYSVTATNSKGCKSLLPFIINEPTQLNATVLINNNTLSCGVCNGTATTTPVGGVGPYNYLWSDGQITPTATGLCKGIYSCDITDDNGCSINVPATIGGPSTLFSAIQGTDLNCFNVCTGSANLIVSGGISPYSYLWSNGEVTEDISGLCAGNYSVVVTDAAGCVSNSNIIISEPTALQVNILSTPPSCGGVCDGNANANIAGGVAPYNYLWNNGSINASLNGLCPNTYNVVVTDAKGCVTNDSIVLPNSTVTFTVSGTSASCVTTCDGSATINISSGTAPFTYKWSDPLVQNTQTATGLCGGLYLVEVTDATGCTASINHPVNTATIFTIATAVTPIDCYGECTGQATLTPSGGLAPYTYLWNDPTAQDSATATTLCTGSYSAIVTDAKGCSNTASISITQGNLLTASLTGINSGVTCGACTGQGTLVANGGSGTGYTYSWSTGTNVASINSLCSGSYTGTVTDSKGCTADTILSINESNLDVTAIITDASCIGSCDGFMDLSVIGGIQPYSYVWSNAGPNQNHQMNLCPTILNVEVTDASGCKASTQGTIIAKEIKALTVSTDSTATLCAISCDGTIKETISGGYTPYTIAWNTGETTDSIFNLCATTYTVTITDSIGCDTTHTVRIIAPPVLNVNTIGTTVLCKGVCNALATATVSGGTAPYTYLWNDPANQTSASALGLCVGTHTVVVTDANGCTATTDYIVTEPALALSSNFVVIDPKCTASCDGSLTVTANGGTTPYTYLWNDPAGQKTFTANNLCVGTWDVVIKDNNGCTSIATTNLTAPTPLTLNLNATNETCDGVCDGNITSTPSGGTTPYTYLWNDGSAQATQNTSALCRGTYMLTVTDNNNCQISSSEIILPGDAPQAGFSDNGDQCLAGNSFTFINGGTTGQTYAWSFGDGNTSTSENPTHSYATAGTFTVTQNVIQNGCSDTYLKTIEVFETPIINLVATNSLCATACNGSIDLTTTAGTSPFNYSWSNGSTMEDPTNLCPGAHNITVTDFNGCIVTGGTNITEPSTLSMVMNSPINNCGVSCSSSASTNVNGGATPYTYLWSNTQINSTATNLCPGTFGLTVTDNNGCVINDSITVVVDTLELFFLDANDITCNGLNDGSIFIGVNGGSTPYTYNWSNSATSKDLIGISPSTYTVTVTDAAGCSITGSTTILEPAVLTANTISQDILCEKNLCNGEATGSYTGGIPPYIISWSNGESVASIDSLCSGNYTFTVTDGNLCQANKIAVILDQDICDSLVIIAIATPDTICIGACTNLSANVFPDSLINVYSWTSIPAGFTSALKDPGNICPLATTKYIVEVTAGTDIAKDTVTVVVVPLPIVDLGIDTSICDSSTITLDAGIFTSYLWSTTETTRTIDVSDGNYTVTVTNSNGCTATDDIIVSPIFTVVNAGSDVSICNGLSTVLGASGTTTYSWSPTVGLDNPAIATPTATPTTTTTYTVTGTNTTTGCTATDDITVTVNSNPIADAGTDTSILCSQTTDLLATANSGTSPYNYQWTSGPATNTYNGRGVGSYTITITDANNCEGTDIVIVSNGNSNLALDLKGDTTICANQSVPLTGIVTNAIGNVSYSWTNSLIVTTPSQNVTPSVTTIYSLTVTDDAGCSTTEDVEIRVTPDISIVTTANPICVGQSTSITTNVVGASPFDYKWSPSSTLSDNIISNPTATPTTTTDYTLIVTDAKGCIDSTKIKVIVNPVPTVNAGLDQDLCLGSAINLTGNGTATTYTWKSLPSGNVIGGVNIFVAPGSNTCYQLTGIDVNGCSATDTICINTISSPTADFDFPIACVGDQVSFTNSSSAAISYAWDFGDGGTSTVRTPNHTFSTSRQYIVSLTATANGGCFSRKTKIITVNPGPTPTFTVDKTSDCGPFSPKFINTSTPINPNYNWLWNFGDGQTLVSNSDTILHTYSGSSGSYNVSLTATNNNTGCKTTFNLLTPLTLVASPIADFEATPWEATILNPNIEFNDLSLNANIWLWNFGDSTTSTEIDPTHTYSDIGVYPVLLTIENIFGCIDSISKNITIKSTDQFWAPNTFTPDGNGLNEGFIPKWYGMDDESFTMMIFNRWGELIYETDVVEPWNGKMYNTGEMVQLGLYVWRVRIKDLNGGKHSFIGHVNILR